MRIIVFYFVRVSVVLTPTGDASMLLAAVGSHSTQPTEDQLEGGGP